MQSLWLKLYTHTHTEYEHILHTYTYMYVSMLGWFARCYQYVKALEVPIQILLRADYSQNMKVV